MFERLRPLYPYLRRYWKSLAWGGVAVILYNVLKVLIPLVIGHAIDDMNHGVTQQKIVFHALRLLLLAALSAIFLYITRQVIIGASREIEFDLRNDLFANLERQSPSYYHTHRTGDIMARTTNDLNAVRQLLGPAIMYSANTIVFMTAALPFMYRISPKLTFFAFVPLPAASVLVQYFGARIHRRFERIQAMFSDISAKAQENFSGARLIRAFAQEDAEIASFETANQEYIGRCLHLVRLMAMLWPTLELVLGLSLMITLLVGGHEVILHRISAGEFTAFIVYMVQLTWPMIAVGWVVNLFQRGTASVVRIDELLKQQPAIADDPALIAAQKHVISTGDGALGRRSGETPVFPSSLPTQPSPLQGEITFRNLTFAYPSGPNVLHNINLHIPAGSSLAIVGPTGSGKSTLVNLIPRLLDAAPGSVLIDGSPIRCWPLADLRAAIGFVPQETFLFSDTIRRNIAFGTPDATDQQIEDAAEHRPHRHRDPRIPPRLRHHGRRARHHPLRRPEAAHRHRPRRQSATQRILILDDALASVDTYTEEQILTGLRERHAGPHHHLHLPPHLHLPQRRPDRRPRQPAASPNSAPTTNCSPATATTPASSKSNASKKSSPSPPENHPSRILERALTRHRRDA